MNRECLNSPTRNLGLALALLALWLEASAIAGGFSVTTFGSRRTGMLANMAADDEITTLYHNPAALADLKGLRLHGSNSFSFLDTEFRLQGLDPDQFPEIVCADPPAECSWPVGQDGYYTKDIRPLSTFGILPYVGISTDLGLVSSALKNVVISAAITAPNFYAGELPADAPSSYYFIEGHFLVLSSMFGVGWRINDWLAVGGTAMYNYMQLEYAQRFSLANVLWGKNGENALVAKVAQAAVGDVRMNISGTDHGFGWTLGALISPFDWLSIGVAFNDATDPRLESGVKIQPLRAGMTLEKFEEQVALFGYELPTGLIVEMPIPPFLSAGVNVHFWGRFEVGFDCRVWFYNVYETQVLEPIYAPGGTGKPAITKEGLSQEKDYSASYDLSLGFLVRPFESLPEIEFLAGAGFDKSPVPDERFTIDNPSMDNWRVAGGARWSPPDGFRIALTYVYMGYIERNVTTSKTSPPLNARGRGSNQFPRLEIEYVF